MGAKKGLVTGHPVASHGIYQSVCSCRTALTLLVGQELPNCLGCDDAVEWRLVQVIRPSAPPPTRTSSSGTRYKAAQSRARLDSASGDD